MDFGHVYMGNRSRGQTISSRGKRLRPWNPIDSRFLGVFLDINVLVLEPLPFR
ncbi:uncharacterized protein FOMMEDRAFT_138868 [Fomitiporia mediterranea MF3/22]|uniref:uncharacterized protein n=1 Tax=Fomitiporia mediterranea (strain MF3/22) TaxID=694068 RepID=UPI0004408E6E|nr:uncharacterized protein FOMMEDRAFT_138868 [Fomitiporia mediterranea MF3/22]EJD05386.1 hypothetical protein FOMMEDRAFT_138868 [Fomitiporia mediterranea MF3/22]